MKKWVYTLIMVVTAILAGCNEEIDTNKDDTNMPKIIEVSILNKDTFDVGEQVKLAAQVRQGEELVNDANEVKFEVWESGLRDEGTTLDGKFTKDGTYTADFTFKHDGVYYMFAHTTARGMHVMPKMKLIVGNPDMTKVLEDNSNNNMNHNQHDDESNDEDDHNEH